MSSGNIAFSTPTGTGASTGFEVSVSTGGALVGVTAVLADEARRGKAQRPKFDPADAMQRAVYNHIRAVRALGRVSIDVGEVARALGVSARDVTAAVAGLQSKGVKISK